MRPRDSRANRTARGNRAPGASDDGARTADDAVPHVPRDARAAAEPAHLCPNCLASSARPEAQSEDRLAELIRAVVEPMLAAVQTSPSLLTLRDVARDLRVSTRTVQRMVKAERFPAPIPITPGCVRWRRADIDGWLAR